VTKDTIQAEALAAWQQAGHVGLVVLGTGLGKTRLGGNAIRALRPTSTLIVTSRIPLIKQWQEEVNLPNVDYMCINSAYKASGSYDLLIVDECHRSVSESFRAVYTNVQYKKLLCLTATLPEKNLEVLENIAPLVYSKSISDVYGNEEIVSNYFVYNYVVDMDRVTASKYKIFSDLFMEATIKLSKLKTDEFKSIYDVAKHYSKSYEKSEIVRYSKQYWSAMSMRRRVLQNNLSKIKVAHDIVSSLGSHRKWIIVCGTIEYAKMLYTVLGDNTLIYHSGMSTKEKEEALANFRNGTYSKIVAVKALNEGIDVPEADSLLVVSGDSTELEATQLCGRVIRARHGKTAVMINLSTINTVEEKWKNKRSSQFNPKWINQVSQIVQLA